MRKALPGEVNEREVVWKSRWLDSVQSSVYSERDQILSCRSNDWPTCYQRSRETSFGDR